MLGKILTFSLKRKANIRFWYDPATTTLYVQHVRSGTIEPIEDPMKITHFLDTYNLKLSDCKGIKEDEDKLGFFAKIQIAPIARSN
jgi:hypothetical protein